MEMVDEDVRRVLLWEAGVSVEGGEQRFWHSVLGRWCSVIGWSGQVSRAGGCRKRINIGFMSWFAEDAVCFLGGVGTAPGVLVLGCRKVDDQVLPGEKRHPVEGQEGRFWFGRPSVCSRH